MRLNRGTVFFAIGIAFVAIGASGRPAFLGVGVAFLVIGSGLLVRGRRR
jgi:hypothetical protein